MKYITFFIIGILSVLLLSNCKKSEYLTDGGLHEAKTSLNTYDYLKSHKYHLFDTLITVVDHYNLKEEMNASATVFAPTNYAINNYLRLRQTQRQLVDENARYTLTDMYKDLTADSVRIYFVKSRVELLTTQFDAVKVENNGGMSAAIQRIQQPKGAGDWSSAPIYNLYYTKVRGSIDPTNNPPTDATADIRVKCQTTGIETVSGKMLHVLNNQHIFVRF